MKRCCRRLAANLAFILATLAIGLPLAAQPAPPAPPAGPESANGIGPKIQFATPIYDFGRAAQGDNVNYTFVFTNAGDATLEITNVVPGCHCTTAGEWSKRVEPGKTGSIPIVFDTHFLVGGLARLITVTCNDRMQQQVLLQLRGTIWKRFDLQDPIYLPMMPGATSNATAEAKILNNMDESVTLSQPQSDRPGFTAEVQTVKPGKEFRLLVTAAPLVGAENAVANISIKTSSTTVPVIGTRALAVVQRPPPTNSPAPASAPAAGQSN